MEQFDRFFLGAMRRYADFTGRNTRQEFWMYILFWVIIVVVLSVVDAMLGTLMIAAAFQIATIIPNLAIGARRLHDTGRSGWWQLLNLIPIIGFIVLIVFFVQPSQEDNEFGPKPDSAPTA